MSDAVLDLEILPIGGLGEFGMNMMLYRHGDDGVIIDAGLMFADEPHFGLDRILPDFDLLEDCPRLHGLILTHGHEDHIGAVGDLLKRCRLPIYGTPYTRALVQRRLSETALEQRPAMHDLPEDAARIELGPFAVSTVRVAHSIPQTRMICLEVAGHRLLHTGDFKLTGDLNGGETTDREALERLGQSGIDLLLVDSTNANREGVTPGESEALAGIDACVAEAGSTVFVCTFASHVRRVEGIGRIASRHGRRLALAGASLRTQVGIAEQLGIVRFPPGVPIAVEAIESVSPQERLVVVAGTQGEASSTMSRLAEDQHRLLRLESGDRLLHAARMIPGNEARIGRMLDQARRLGVEVMTARDRPIHVSGHPARDELRQLLEWTRPRCVLPIHGEFHQMEAVRQLCADMGFSSEQALVANSGDRIRLHGERLRVEPGPPPRSGLVDEQRMPISLDLLQERRQMAHSGVVCAAIALDQQGRAAAIELTTRGLFGPSRSRDSLIEGAKTVIVEALHDARRRGDVEPEALEDLLFRTLRRYFRRETQRQPLLVPVVLPPPRTID